MPRVTLTEQQSNEYNHPLTVYTIDINYAGHLGNKALLGLVHEVRAYFLKALDFITIVGNKQWFGLIIADLAVNFKAEAYAYDQLMADWQIDELREKSFRLFHRIRRGEQVIALDETGVITFDYQSGHVVTLPDNFFNRITNFS
jgi:acyl-CoA thioesterase FadM